MTVYILLVVLTKITQIEPVYRQQISTTQAVFSSAEKCLKNKIFNENRYLEMHVWDQVKIDCLPEEVVK